MPDTIPEGPGPARAPWRTIYFRLEAPDASRVSVIGDFNGWDPEHNPLARNLNGVWEGHLPLPPGRYTYAFVVDGAWCPDPGCADRVAGPHGEACRLEVSPPASSG